MRRLGILAAMLLLGSLAYECYGDPQASQPGGADLFPSADQIKTDRPRMLIRPAATQSAISLDQLKAIPRDEEFDKAIKLLTKCESPACQAMVYLLTGDKSAADKAVAHMMAFRSWAQAGNFDVFFNLREAALAYDWLYNYEGFTAEMKARVRANYEPLAERGLAIADDHVFHNYIWTSAAGVSLWALATVGEDAAADKLFARIRARMNDNLFPAMAYLDGQFGESSSYWILADALPAAQIVLAAQSESGKDLIGAIRRDHGDWLRRQMDGMIAAVLPNLRFVPWGDMVGGPNGGVTHEVVGVMDGLSWATGSPQAAWLDHKVAKVRKLGRFYGFDLIFYFLYARNLAAKPAEPGLAFLAGVKTVQAKEDLPGLSPWEKAAVAKSPGNSWVTPRTHGPGTVVTRSGWGDGDTVVAFRCTDFFGSHNHFDQGGFFIYRNGNLAIDPDLYAEVGGPQQKTSAHCTLLIGGKGQRKLTAQSFVTLAEFRKNRTEGAKVATGEILRFLDTPELTHVVGQFAQAYPEGVAKSCIRQLLFIRPNLLAVLDEVIAPPGKKLDKVAWLIQLPGSAKADGGVVTASNRKSFIRCWAADPNPNVKATITIGPSLVGAARVSYEYEAGESVTMLHLIQVGDGPPPADWTRPESAVRADGSAMFKWMGTTYELFGAAAGSKKFQVWTQAD